MKTIIHVNQHKIRSNAKNGTDEPCLTVKTYKDNRYTSSAIIRDEDGKCFGTEFDFGNAAELHMVLCEMNPEKKLSMVEIDEVPGA